MCVHKSLSVKHFHAVSTGNTHECLLKSSFGKARILTFFDDHGEQALRYLRKKGMGKHRRGSNSESGMRRLRRLEKNHDGIRSPATRQHYMQIYQAIKYLSLDMAAFIEQGPQMTGPPRM